MITSANKKGNNRLVALTKKHKLLNNTIDNLSKSSLGLWEDSKIKEMKVEKLKLKEEIERIKTTRYKHNLNIWNKLERSRKLNYYEGFIPELDE